MSFSFRSVLTAIAVLGLFVSPALIGQAKAEVFFWQDPVSKVSLTFPDTWRVIHNQKPDDVLTIVAPSDGAFPMCRLRVREDLRHRIYPARYADELQRVYYGSDFWDKYAAEYAQATVEDTHENAGLGRGFASYAHISFVSDAGPKMKRRGLVFASLYHNKVYILECSAEQSAFDQWYDPFLSVVKSVDFRQEVFQFPGMFYRPLPDPLLKINGEREIDVGYY